MKNITVALILACLMATSIGSAFACEYKRGETKFADYAKCRYGDEAVVVVDLPEGSAYEQCVYFAQAFRPPKLLAITKQENGKEVASINDRAAIGNPCYLSKASCDAAFKASQ